MAIFKEDEIPSKPEVERPEPVTETATVYEDQMVEEANRPLNITELEGTPWPSTWYSQILGKDDYPTRLDFALDPSLQQYCRINNFILKYTDPLALETDDNVISTLSGEANVFPSIVPNQWDMFTARTKEGRIGLFTVTELPRRLTYLSYAAYNVQYDLVGFLDPMSRKDLERKTVKELYFNPDNPLCPTENLVDIIDRKEVIRRFIKYLDIYYAWFFDRRESTFILNKDGVRYYDDALTEFFNSLIPHKARDKTRHPVAQRYSVPSNGYQNKSRTIYDVLHDNEDTMFDYVDQEYIAPDAYDFFSEFVMHSILMTTIHRTYFPSQMQSLAGDHDVVGTYVFSKEFYDREPKEELEQLVYQLLLKEEKAFKQADELIELSFKTNNQEKLFHLIPVYLWIYLRYL